jgi:tetratricopeptide (TPR) repeat protein
LSRKKPGGARANPQPDRVDVRDSVDGRSWFALAIFGVALLVRLVHVWQIRASPFFSLLMGDSRGYDEWAQRIAGGDWLGHEVFYQAPLYPYLLGLIYAVAGRHLLLVRLVQAVIGSGSCALLALAAARLFSRRTNPEHGRRIGLVAGLMLACYAPAIFFDGLLQKSVLDVFFVCLALWLLSRSEETAEAAKTAEKNGKNNIPQRSQRSPRFLLYVALGLTMGGLALTRENALVFIVVILGWMVLNDERTTPNVERRTSNDVERRTTPNAERRTNDERRTPNVERLHRAAVFLIGLAIVLVPVAARNAYVGGGFYLTTSQFGPNFYIGNNPGADGTYQSLRFGRGAPEYERQDATELAEHATGRRLTPAEVSSYWTDKALTFVTSRPGAWLTLMGRKVALLSNATEMVDTESQEAYAEWSLPLRLGGFVGHFGLLVPLALFGVIVTWPMRSRLWVFYAMTIAYATSVVVFYVFARYRYPLVPLLIPFAAAGLVEGPAWLAGSKRTRPASPVGVGQVLSDPSRAAALAAVVAAGIFCNWPLLSTTLMRAVTETNLGSALQEKGRLDEAIDHYHRAIALAPDFPPAYNNLATTLRAKGDLANAVATYEQALRVRPDYPEAQYNLANALLQEGKPAEAIEHFRIALETIPASVDVHNNLGIALMDQGHADEAIAEFRAALTLDPDSLQSHRNLANALGSAHRYDEAIEHFHRASQIDPTDASVHYDLGSLLMEIDRLDEAIAEFRAALRIDPRSAKVLNNLGIALGSQGRMDDAIAQFRQALVAQPDFEDAKRNLAVALQVRRRD